MSEKNKLYILQPGKPIPDDWYNGIIPKNIEVGENTVIDSSFCFKNFYSVKPIGFKIGNNVTLWRTSIAAEENAVIEIGNYCYIANAALVCSERISIGNYVFIAGGVTIADSDFHPVDPAMRLADTIALSPRGDRKKRPVIKVLPVVIEDEVLFMRNNINGLPPNATFSKKYRANGSIFPAGGAHVAGGTCRA